MVPDFRSAANQGAKRLIRGTGGAPRDLNPARKASERAADERRLFMRGLRELQTLLTVMRVCRYRLSTGARTHRSLPLCFGPARSAKRSYTDYVVSRAHIGLVGKTEK